MGYLNNTTITVDAILTMKGRELLAQGGQYFNITQFALADTEVDYDNWNPVHQLGSNYYGELISNMPVLEALPDGNTQMHSKLITLDKGAEFIPIVLVNGTTTPTWTFTSAGTQPAYPQTINMQTGNNTYGYTAIISDKSVANLTVSQALPSGVMAPTIPTFIGDADQQSYAVIGMKFEITAAQSLTSTKRATLTIIGNETGGQATGPITVGPVATPISANVL